MLEGQAASSISSQSNPGKGLRRSTAFRTPVYPCSLTAVAEASGRFRRNVISHGT
jgi:hypothetical protein